MPPPPPSYEPFDSGEERRLFHEGIELFNAREFFEAHESWEEIWKNSSGRKARFYQGLIQAAVTLEHIRRDNPRGVQRVWTTMLAKFEGLPEVYMGLNVPRFLDGLRPVVAPILAMPVRQGQQPREVSLPWDPESVPPIELLYDPFETGEAAAG